MKLHLPTVLLVAVLACISQPVIATETINLNSYDWDHVETPWPQFDNVNLSLNGDWSTNPPPPDIYPGNPGEFWDIN